jgi:hypothetical protein
MSISTLGPKQRKRITVLFVLSVSILLLLRSLRWTSPALVSTELAAQSPNDVPLTLILAAVQKDNLTVLVEQSGIRSSDNLVIYVADDPYAPIPMNKGNEAMVYLSYLIDNYDDLPEVMIFMHAGRTSWHNNAILRFNSELMVKGLRRSFVRDHGFSNLRCDESFRCTYPFKATAQGYPAYILTREAPDRGSLESQYKKFREIWDALFPGQPIPEAMGCVPGAQFALTRRIARGVPLDRLKALRQWIIDAELSPSQAGAVFERTWHMIFRGTSNSLACFTPHECFCSLYGICFGAISPSPETLLDEATRSGREIYDMFRKLGRLKYFGEQGPSSIQDSELASLSNGEIGPGHAGLAKYMATLEGDITSRTLDLDSLVRKASLKTK